MIDRGGVVARLGLVLVVALSVIGCGPGSWVGGSDPPQRVVAIAPSIVEMVFALGFGERVVGVGDYAKWPPEAELLPQLGGLFDPRLETLVELEPDLAILLPSEERLALQLEQLDIEVMTVANESIEDIETMAVVIAQRLGDPERAERFLGGWRARMRPASERRNVQVLMPVARQKGRVAEIVIAGPGTFLDQLIARAGARNSMAGSPLTYPQIGLEEILSRQPDVILDLQPSPGQYDELVEDWRNLGEGDLLVTTCVRVIAGDHVLIPGPRLPRLYREIVSALDSCSEAG